MVVGNENNDRNVINADSIRYHIMDGEISSEDCILPLYISAL